MVIFLFVALFYLANSVGACNAGVAMFFGLPFVILYSILNLIGVTLANSAKNTKKATSAKIMLVLSGIVGAIPFLLTYATVVILVIVVGTFLQVRMMSSIEN